MLYSVWTVLSLLEFGCVAGLLTVNVVDPEELDEVGRVPSYKPLFGNMNAGRYPRLDYRWLHASNIPSNEIKVISAGFGRSASTALECALTRLGYNPTNGYIPFVDGQKYLKPWMDWAIGGSFEAPLKQILSMGFNATTCDQPTGLAWEELILRFPNAKVLDVLHPNGAEGFVKDVELNNWFGCFTGVRALVSQFVDCCNFNMRMTNATRREVCKRDYISTHEKIVRTVPPENLLSYSVDMGYSPLCKHLGVPEADCPTEEIPYVSGGRACPYRPGEVALMPELTKHEVMHKVVRKSPAVSDPVIPEELRELAHSAVMQKLVRKLTKHKRRR